MAEAAPNQSPSGYDENFVTVVEEDFQCLICHLPLKEPVQTRCGHRFCKECLEEHLRRQGVQDQLLTCPADRKGLHRDRDVFPDKATERKILSLAINCPSEGCDWTGELRNKQEHLVSCLFKLVFCTNENCHVTMQRKDLEEHVTITCLWRILACDHCSELHPKCKMQDHIVQCSKFPAACPNMCGHSILREMIPNHTENDCPLTIISCPYLKTGCEIKLQRKQMESHLQSATSFHLALTCVKLENAEFRLTNTEAKLYETQVKLSNTEAATKKLTEKLDILQRQFENKLAEDQRKAVEEKMVMAKTESPFFPREFIWKITDFSEILRQAKTEENKTIESVPFYTEHYGYKIKVTVYPNGHKSGNNTHLSVYISVMKGEYDAILPWPFKKEVRVILIDQLGNPSKRKNVVKWVRFPGKSSSRPINEENEKTGRAEFISHDKLRSKRYLVDDTLFLQVEVGSL